MLIPLVYRCRYTDYVREEGPEHSKTFTTEVLINEEVVCLGEGKSKKSAEQIAAKKALEIIKKRIEEADKEPE